MTRPALFRVEAPTSDVVDLADVKAHLRIDGAAEDPVLQSILDTAIAMLDGATGEMGRAILEQTWVQTQPRPGSCVMLQLPPFRELVSIQYENTLGEVHDLAIEDFRVTKLADGFGMISPKPGKHWPSMSSAEDALRIMFRAGYDEADVPPQIKSAIRLLVGHFDKEREGTTVAPLREIPIGVDRLIEPFRAKWIA